MFIHTNNIPRNQHRYIKIAIISKLGSEYILKDTLINISELFIGVIYYYLGILSVIYGTVMSI